MKKINFAITILILSLLILSACTGGNKNAPQGSFIGGKEGVSAAISIESTSGGNVIFDNNVDPFRIIINLQNKGEDEVAEGEALVTLDGINFNAFQIVDPTL